MQQQRSIGLMRLAVILILLFWQDVGSEAFSPAPPPLATIMQELICSTTSNRDLVIAAAGRGGGGLFGQDNNSKGFGKSGNNKPKTTLGGGGDGGGGSKLVLMLPATNVKVGPLRFYLQVFLSGEIQNVPVKNSWLTQQGEGDGEIQVYYQDGSGMISIQLDENKITMTRRGTSPSLTFLLQESILLHSVLDELNAIAFDVGDDIDPSKRLLQFVNDDAIETARKTLPAQRADPTNGETM